MPLNFFQHIHSLTIPAVQNRWRYTLGAGGTAIFLALVLVVSVLSKIFYCIPATGEVALSVQEQDFARTSHKKGCRFYGLKKMIWGR